MHQADDGDIYVERVNWAAGLYQRGDGWLPLRRETETIHVKDGPDVAVDVARTVHGPIVSRLDDASGLALARGFAPADLPQGPRAFLEAERAKTGAELLTAWSHYAGPSVNVCWADDSGSIGLKVAGALPRRRAGDGRFPVPGWVDTYDWDGTIPAAELPAISDPRDGIVVTANDDWSTSSRRLSYPGVYADSDRALRARQLATSLQRATVADMRAMQNDVYSAYAARIVSALRGIVMADPRAKKAMSVLARWDARAETRGPARLFYAFMKQIRAAATPQNAPVTWSVLERMIDGSGAQQYWGELQPPDGRTRANRIESALSKAMETVERQDGPDPAHWSFGRAHRLVYQHPFASALPPWVARRLAFGPVGLPGELHTLDVAWFPLRGDGYDVTQIPSARFIVDLASPDASRLVLPLGQSGQLFDRHGSDQMSAWSTGHDFALPFTAKAIQAATISTLRLVPGN
jgi:penicillin amidase